MIVYIMRIRAYGDVRVAVRAKAGEMTYARSAADGDERVLQAHHRLPAKQAKVGWLVAHGRSTTEAADELGIEPRTVREHIDRLVARTQTRDRDHLHTWLKLHLDCCVEPVAVRRPPPWDQPKT